MVRRQHNQARVVGTLLIVLGVILVFVSGSGQSLIARTSGADLFSGNGGLSVSQPLLIQGEDGDAKILVPRSGGRRLPRVAEGNNAAGDPNFQWYDETGGGNNESLMEFLGLYDSDLFLALEVLFFAAGGILILVSYLTRR